MKSCASLAAAMLLVAVSTSLVHAQTTRYWDDNSTSPGAADGFGIADGFWTSADVQWNTDPTGGGAGTFSAWTNPPGTYVDHAVFSAGNDVGTDPLSSGAFITITGAQSAATVTFEEGFYDITGGTNNWIDTPQTTIQANAHVRVTSILDFSTLAGKITLQGGGIFESENYGHAGSFIRNNQSLEIDGSGTIKYDDVYTPDAGDCDCTIYNTVSPSNNTILGVGGTTTNGGAGTLIKTGAAEIRFQGTGLPLTTYAKLVVQEGLFRLGAAASVQDMRGFGADPLVETPDAITLDGGDIGTSFTLANATMHPNRGITVTSNGGGFSVGGGSMNIPGPLTGSGPLRISHTLGAAAGGTVVLSHANNVNTFSGAITQTSGTLRLDSSLSPGSLAGVAGTTVSINGPAVTLTTGSDGSTTTYSGTISGTGSLVKTGGGTFTMDGTKSYTGDTTVLGGTLSTNSDSLADLADVYLNTGSFLNLNFAATDTIDSLFIDGASQAVGLWGAVGNGAATFTTPLITGSGLLNVTSMAAAGLLGDFNEDDVVDAADYITWRKNTSNNPLPNDDGLATQAARYNLWVTNYGMSNPGGGSGGGAAVPEPASLALLMLGLAVGLFGRRSR